MSGVSSGERHGMRWSATYGSWQAMRARCLNASHDAFKDYGGRGVKICARWNSFNNFLRDMGERPSSQHTIGRIKNDGNYEPGNCQWETRLEQGNNKRNCRLVEFGGETKTIAQWAAVRGMSRQAMHQRLQRLSVAEALTMSKAERRSA